MKLLSASEFSFSIYSACNYLSTVLEFFSFCLFFLSPSKRRSSSSSPQLISYPLQISAALKLFGVPGSFPSTIDTAAEKFYSFIC
jgi:hypothetical protein